MNANPPQPPPPTRADRRERMRTRANALGLDDAKAGFLVPLLTSLIVLAVAYLRAPDIDADTLPRYSTLFSTTGQIIITLLVALAIELRSLRELNAQRLVIGGTLAYVAFGAGAAVLALNPTLQPGLYRWLFAITLAGAVGALLSVVLIAYRGLEGKVKGRRNKATRD